MTSLKVVSISVAVGLGLSGCVTSQRHLSPDFGSALGQDVAAQIADPDARYSGDPDPGSDPSRVALAQQRYRTGKVIQPVASASEIGKASVAPVGQ